MCFLLRRFLLLCIRGRGKFLPIGKRGSESGSAGTVAGRLGQLAGLFRAEGGLVVAAVEAAFRFRFDGLLVRIVFRFVLVPEIREGQLVAGVAGPFGRSMGRFGRAKLLSLLPVENGRRALIHADPMIDDALKTAAAAAGDGKGRHGLLILGEGSIRRPMGDMIPIQMRQTGNGEIHPPAQDATKDGDQSTN